jgi:hypothetical protein
VVRRLIEHLAKNIGQPGPKVIDGLIVRFDERVALRRRGASIELVSPRDSIGFNGECGS